MARYKVSNKNVYGLNSGMFFMMGICLPVLLVFGVVFELLIAPLFYDGYVEKLTLDEGAAGTASTEETPVAASIADMERMTDGFTFLTSGTVLKYDTVRIGEAIYHRITLESGERVIARINRKALTAMEDIGIYRLPVGVWREWTPPDEVLIYTTLADNTHYIDMYGDYRPIASVEDFSYTLRGGVLVWAYIIVLLIFRVVGVRRWRFAPAIFASRDPLLPRNDLECWCAATFAVWSHSFDGMEGYPLITGVRGTRKRVKWFRDSLAEQWDIHNREEGLQTVHQLTDRWAGEPDAQNSGWDLCRATQLLGMMYLVKMLDRNELDREFSRAGRIIQQKFSSWDELVASYLAGLQAWLSRTGQNVEGTMAFRRGIFARLKQQGVSPYSIPWDTELTWLPGVSGNERTFTRHLLKSYRGDF